MKSRLVMALLWLIPAGTAAGDPVLPASLELRYELRFGGVGIGHVTKTLKRDVDGTYRHRSRSVPEGMARAFTSVEWFEEGRFEVVNGTVRPLTFLEYRVGADKSHRHSAIFDWKRNEIRYAHGPVVALPSGTQDQGSMLYAFMLRPPTGKESQTMHISTGKKLKPYRYAFAGHETIKTVLGNLRTLIVDQQTGGSDDDGFRVWLASDRNNLPVRILTRKRGRDTVLELQSASSSQADPGAAVAP